MVICISRLKWNLRARMKQFILQSHRNPCGIAKINQVSLPERTLFKEKSVVRIIRPKERLKDSN